MLQSIRDKSRGWIAYVIIGFISVPFALWGIDSYIGGSGGRIAATVNGEDIPAAEVQNEILQQKERMAQMFGGQLPNLGDEMFAQNALSTVIQNTLLRQQIREGNYRVSNAELVQAIAAIPAFQTEGKFDQEKYERLLTSQRRDPATFEMEYRRALAFDQYENFAQATDFLPEDQLQKYRQLQNQQRDIAYYTVKAEDYRAGLAPSEEDIKGYYDRNLSAYMTEEKVKLAYIELNEEKIAENIHVDDAILQAFYDKNQDLYVEPEQRQAAHIQIDFDPNGGDAAVKAAEEKAQSLFQQLVAGEKTFAELAKTASNDTLSADQGGDLGFVAMGDMDPEFERMLFALDKDGISEPIKLEDRFEIIQLLAIKDAKQKSFEDVKADVDKEYRQQEAGNQFLDQSEQLQTLAYENEGSLEPAADAIGAKIENSDWVSQANGGEGIGQHAPVRDVAFSDAVLKENRNSEAIEISDTHMIVVRVLEHEKARQKTLDEVRDDVKSAVIEQKIRETAKTDGEALFAKLKESNTWDALSTTAAPVVPAPVAPAPAAPVAPAPAAPVAPALAAPVETAPATPVAPAPAAPVATAPAAPVAPAPATPVAPTPAATVNSPQQLGLVSRSQADIPPTILETAFKMTRPTEGQKTWKGFVDNNGDYVIISLNAVKDGETSGSDAPVLGGQSSSMILNALREAAEVETFPENL